MDVSIKDASQYFRGLLILIRRDGVVTSRESDAVARLGAKLGFEREFCTRAIEDILANTHIDEMPPVFESFDLARKFIMDGLRVTNAERSPTMEERMWLEMTAETNGCDGTWFHHQCALAAEAGPAHRAWEYESLCVIHGSRSKPAPMQLAQGGS